MKLMQRELPYAKKEGIPATMCERCGCPHEKHESATDCIAYWRGRTALLEFQLVEHPERRSIPRDIPRHIAG
jgi:hypothetical protein